MPVAVAIIIALITLINSWHVISQAWINPPNHFFIGIAHYFADYFLYISQIAQGAHGWSLFARHQFTNEPMPPTWIYWFNVMLGKFHINPFLTYDLAIIIESIIVLTLIWYMLRLALTNRTTQYIAFILLQQLQIFLILLRICHAEHTLSSVTFGSLPPQL